MTGLGKNAAPSVAIPSVSGEEGPLAQFVDHDEGDACAVAAIRGRVEGAGSLREALKSVALEPWFREKVEGAR